jgi:hypothetical protein
VEDTTGPLHQWETDIVQHELRTTYKGRIAGGGHILTAWWRAIAQDCLPHRHLLLLPILPCLYIGFGRLYVMVITAGWL